jgi:hypothetical protein
MKSAERSLYEKEWRSRNKERVRRINYAWKLNHPEIISESNHAYAMRHKQKIAEKVKRWRLANAERHRSNNRLLHQRYKRQVIDAYGGHCFCCGENELRFLTLEHTLRNGKTHRQIKGVFYLSLIRRGFPKDEGLAVLCMNCNWATRLGDKCPHQRSILELIA